MNTSMQNEDNHNHDNDKDWIAVQRGVLITLGVCIVTINATVLILFATSKRQKRIFDVLLMNQAAVDLVHGLLLVPAKLLTIWKWNIALLTYGKVVCLAHYLSAFSHFLITAERCYAIFAIATPLLYHAAMTNKVACKQITAVWLSAVVLAVSPFSWWQEDPTETSGNITEHYASFSAFLLLIMVILILALAVIQFFSALKWKFKKVQNLEQCPLYGYRTKVINSIFIVCAMVLFYCITYLPTMMTAFFDIRNIHHPELKLVDVSAWAYLLTPIFNGAITVIFKFWKKMNTLHTMNGSH